MKTLLGLAALAASLAGLMGSAVGAPNCKVYKQPLDVLFILDESTSVGRGSFEKLKDFVEEFAVQADNPEGRFGVIKFSGRVNGQIYFESDLDKFNNQLQRLGYTGGSTHTSQAIKFVNNHYLRKTKNFKREGSKRVVIIATDGNPQQGYGGEALIDHVNYMMESGTDRFIFMRIGNGVEYIGECS